jgi:hypothetical protein
VRFSEGPGEYTTTPQAPKIRPTITQSSGSRKTTAPSFASFFSRLYYGHSLASGKKPTSMAKIIKRVTSATGTPSGIKSYLSTMKASRSVLKNVAPSHAGGYPHPFHLNRLPRRRGGSWGWERSGREGWRRKSRVGWRRPVGRARYRESGGICRDGFRGLTVFSLFFLLRSDCISDSR